MKKKIAIIGGGNIGGAIANGLLNSKFIDAGQLTISKRNVETLSSFKEMGVNVVSDNRIAVSNADYVILAVKPFQIQDLAREINSYIVYDKQVLVSVITGVWLNDLQELFSTNASLFRAMPNTAACIGESMTSIASRNASSEQIQFVQNLFNTIGKSVIIDEALMDAATVLGACGTAFALRFIRANIQGGIDIGFDAKTATLIAAQTIMGAGKMLLANGTHPEQEIDKVTTPKGCTIAGLNEMEHQGFSSSLIRGVKASYERIVKDM